MIRSRRMQRFNESKEFRDPCFDGEYAIDYRDALKNSRIQKIFDYEYPGEDFRDTIDIVRRLIGPINTLMVIRGKDIKKSAYDFDVISSIKKAKEVVYRNPDGTSSAYFKVNYDGHTFVLFASDPDLFNTGLLVIPKDAIL